MPNSKLLFSNVIWGSKGCMHTLMSTVCHITKLSLNIVIQKSFLIASYPSQSAPSHFSVTEMTFLAEKGNLM